MSDPVLIVGAGLAGLTSAIALRRHGVPAVVVEKHAGTSIQPKARRFNFRTMEIFRSLHAADEVYRAAEGLAAYEGMRAGRTLAESTALPPPPHVDLSALADLGPERSCLVAQDLLEPVLADLARRRGAPVHFRTRLLDLAQDDDGVTARLRDEHTGRVYPLRASHLIGADGAHSSVRDLLGITRSGRGTLGDAVTVCFTADLARVVAGREFNLCQTEHPDAPGALASIDGRRRWMFYTGPLLPVPADGRPSAAEAKRWVDLLHTALGEHDVHIDIDSVAGWQPAMRVADRFADGRVLLAGDAAHVMTPYAALGANTAIQDAANLAWKIAAIRHGQAGPALLDSYDAERRPAGYRAAEQSSLRTGDLRSLGADTQLDHPLALVAGYQYTDGAMLADGSDPQPTDRLELTGRPGTRVPHLPLSDRSSTLDAPGAPLGLVCGPDSAGWRAAADALSVPITRAGPDWPGAAGIGRDGALLVRPDQIVAWRCAGLPADPHAGLDTAVRGILARSQPA